MNLVRCSKRGVMAGLVALLLVSLVLGFGCAKREATPTPTPQPQVEIIIYTDFQCRSCEELNLEVEGELLRLYVNTGKAIMEVRLLSSMGNESLLAAEAALCAADQDKFWEYSKAIFAAWRQSGKAAYTEGELIRIATELGLDQETLVSCLADGTKWMEIEGNNRIAEAAGLGALPTVFINDNKIVGKQPLQTYVDIIEQLLSGEQANSPQ